MSDTSPFRWAIFGTGPVARKFALGLRVLVDRAAIATVASRDPENARRFALDLGVPKAAERYSDALSDGIDAVYIATPPSLHEEHAKLAIGAGKAVLVEKPFALDAGAADRIANVARDAGVFCMEAMWTRFLPLIAAVRAELDRGAIGEIRGFHASFLGANRPEASSSLFDPARGGGALMHRGVYPLSLARFFLGPIDTVKAIGLLGETGVDEDCVLTLSHASGAVSSLRASLRVAGDSRVTVYGTAGTLEIATPIYRPMRAVLSATHPQDGTSGKRSFEAFRETTLAQRLSGSLGPLLRRLRTRDRNISGPFLGNGYHYEAVALMDAVMSGQTESPVMPLADSIEIMLAIDRARAQFHQGEAL